METNQNKIKSIIALCVVAIVILLLVSIALVVNIHISNKKIKEQEQHLSELEQIIENYNNLPEDGSSDIIIQGEN